MIISGYFILTYVVPNMALDTVAPYSRKELRLHMNSQTFSNREMELWSKESIWFPHTKKYEDLLWGRGKEGVVVFAMISIC